MRMGGFKLARWLARDIEELNKNTMCIQVHFVTAVSVNEPFGCLIGKLLLFSVRQLSESCSEEIGPFLLFYTSSMLNVIY